MPRRRDPPGHLRRQRVSVGSRGVYWKFPDSVDGPPFTGHVGRTCIRPSASGVVTMVLRKALAAARDSEGHSMPFWPDGKRVSWRLSARWPHR